MKTNVPPEQEASPQGTSPESDASPALTKTQATRRRILGATFGAPLIYTLPSGALQAASSSLCEDNSANYKTVTVNEDGNVRLSTESAGKPLCKLDGDQCVLSDGSRWVYQGTPYSETTEGQGTLFTQSCWTSMGTGTSASLIGTNWSNLG